MSVRLTLTLSYAGFLVVAGALLLTAVWLFLLRYVPDGPIDASLGFIPNRSDLLEAFAPAATAVLLFLLALGLVGGWFLAGRILAPLAQIDSAARMAGQGVLSERIRMAGKGNEFSDTADVFDAMLDQLETHVEEQQRFAANASHELRTPLAITQTLLDVAQKDPDRDVDALLDRLHSVNSRAIELADALLLLTRSRQLPVDLDRVDLSLLAEEAAENLLPLAERRGITLAIEGDAAPVVGSEALLLQMTTNLVHNAIVHNVAHGGDVAVRTAVRSGAAVLTVENPGAQLDPVTAVTLVEPFQRGEGRTRADDHAGTGLGLAIVQNIVHAHRGMLTIAPRRGGGAIVTVRLPVGA